MDDGARNGKSVLFEAESGALGDEIGWMRGGVRRYIVRMMRLTVKRAWESLGVTLKPPGTRLRSTVMGGRLGFFLNMRYIFMGNLIII